MEACVQSFLELLQSIAFGNFEFPFVEDEEGEQLFAFPEETRLLREAAGALLERMRPSEVDFAEDVES